jgi:hypothetical protein
VTTKRRTTVEEETDTPEPDTEPNTDPAPTETDDDGEEVCSVCGLKGRPPGHH